MNTIFKAKVSDSTLDDVISEDKNHRRRWLNLVTLAAVFLVVLSSLLGHFDSKGNASASNGRLTADVTYQSVARAGNEIELEIQISSTSELPQTFDIELTKEYVALFEDLAVFPDPEEQSADQSGTLRLTITAQPGAKETYVKIIGRASDQWDLYTPGTLSIIANSETVEVPVTTWRVP